jgi:putative oxidoreductase
MVGGTDTFDVVIVGSGINSLGCAAVLVRKGRRICVLERNTEPARELLTVPPGRPHMTLLLATSPSWAITVVRVTLGTIFFAHGSQKVFGWFGGHGLKATTSAMTSAGLSLPIAYAVCFFELLGGLGLLFALLTRLAALAVVVVMAGAIATVHGQNGFFLNWELTPGKGHGFEANLAYLAMGLACVIAGGGVLALDRLLLG